MAKFLLIRVRPLSPLVSRLSQLFLRQTIWWILIYRPADNFGVGWEPCQGDGVLLTCPDGVFAKADCGLCRCGQLIGATIESE